MNRRSFSKALLAGGLAFSAPVAFASTKPPAKPEYVSELCGAVIKVSGDGYTEQPLFTGMETEGEVVMEQFMLNRGGEGNLKIWFVQNGPEMEEFFADRYKAMRTQSSFTELETGEVEDGAWWTGGIEMMTGPFGLYGELQSKRYDGVDVYIEWGSCPETFDENLKTFSTDITIDDAEVFTYLEESKVSGKTYESLSNND